MIPELIAYPLMAAAFCLGGAVGALVVGAFWKRDLKANLSYGERLGRPCWMMNRYRKGKKWLKYRVVAVSHKGGIAVRRWDDESGHGAFWVDKANVPATVRFDDPMIGGEQ